MVLDEPPDGVERSQCRLSLTTLRGHHALPRTLLHVLCDVGLHVRERKAQEAHTDVRELLEIAEGSRHHHGDILALLFGNTARVRAITSKFLVEHAQSSRSLHRYH